MAGKISTIDSTKCLDWEVTKEAFDSCEFREHINSPVFNIHVDKESKWVMRLYPKGSSEETKNKVTFRLYMLPGNVKYKVKWGLSFKTPNGLRPDFVEDLYANTGEYYMAERVFDGNGNSKERGMKQVVLLSPESFCKKFILSHNKFTVVSTLVIYVEGINYIHHREMARNFMVNHRSMSDLDMFSDFTIICGDKQFKCHRKILASMSTIFMTMLTNERFLESKENVVEILDSSPDLVEAMLYFMSKGIIPRNIDSKAFGLIHLADKYDLQDLKKACERSLVKNMTVENVIETLIIIDLYNPQSKNRQKIVDFIKSNAAQVTEVEDWTKFVQNYPALVTEVFRAMAAALAAKP